MRIGIIGVGAMGCLFAARLSAVAEVVLVGKWPEQLAALKKGLTLYELDGTQTIHRVSATDKPEQIGAVDFVLVLVKSYQTEHVIGRIAPLLHDKTIIITLQNGVGNYDILASAFGAWRTTVGITAQGANIAQPGVLRHAGNGATILTLTPAIDTELTTLAQMMRDAGLEASTVTDAGTLLWSKLAINAAINPLTALLRVTNGFLASNDDARLIMTAAALEVAAVAQAQGIKLAYPYADNAAEAAQHVAQATAANRSSMLQDIERGSRTEIDAICGAVVRKAESVAIHVPINRRLLHLVQSAENNAPVDHWNVDVGESTIDLRAIATIEE